MKTVDVIIPCNTNSVITIAITECCIHCLRQSETDNVKFNIVIMEQNPDVEWCEADRTIHYDYSFNFNKVLNHGIRETSSDYIMILNNDAFVCRGAVEEMLAAFDYGFGSVSPVDGLRPKDFKRRFKEGYRIDGGQGLGEVKGFCILLQRQVWECIGGFDTQVMFNGSDDIYIDQLKYHGLKHCVANNALVCHIGKVQRNQLDATQRYLFTEAQCALYHVIKNKYQK